MEAQIASPANLDSATLHQLAERHLWLHFTRMGGGERFPVLVRGAGVYVWDSDGHRYIDGLSQLFCVNIGHGRADVAAAGARQGEVLAFASNWSYSHPRSIELAARVASMAPGDLNRVFFTSGGSEAVESAIKLCRQYHKLAGNPTKVKIIAREVAYHGTSLGALSATGVTALRAPFEPLVGGVGHHVPSTNLYRLTEGLSPEVFAQAIEQRIEFEGPDTVAAVILEPVQNSGGCFPPPAGYFDQVREICDRHDVLLISDEVICAWGRLGEYFGADRYGYQPDIITTAKGITSSYAQLGAVIVSDRIAEPFMEARNMFMHGFTWGGHPVACAVAMANLDVMANEGLLENVRANQDYFRAVLERLYELPIVGDVRGDGYFYGIELVKDRATKETFTAQESEDILRGYVSTELLAKGLICRADDRGDPVIQLAPPLITTREQIDTIGEILHHVLSGAVARAGLASLDR
jgi:adenosylmethionine-8-amino-7-oxononanoate aminotransferase